jgi:antagonist of KipI
MKGIKIINPGFYSTIQDDGRTGYREFGLPLSGAMDKYAFYIANWLVRNDKNEGQIETLFPGLEIEFLSNTIFSVTGANLTPLLNGTEISNWKVNRARKGERLSLSKLVSGTRSYISFSGGFRIDPQLNSMSTYLPGNLGGYRGRELRAGDVIPMFPGMPFIFRDRIIPNEQIPDYDNMVELRVLEGANFDLFSADAKDNLVTKEYLVTSNSDRMGLRLDGELIKPTKEEQLLSYGIQPGAIQVPGNGLPIIMGADCQTIGGYPQIANIISADQDIIGQLKPGDQVKFKMISRNEALEALINYTSKIDSLFGTSKAKVCTDCIEKRR